MTFKNHGPGGCCCPPVDECCLFDVTFQDRNGPDDFPSELGERFNINVKNYRINVAGGYVEPVPSADEYNFPVNWYPRSGSVAESQWPWKASSETLTLWVSPSDDESFFLLCPCRDGGNGGGDQWLIGFRKGSVSVYYYGGPSTSSVGGIWDMLDLYESYADWRLADDGSVLNGISINKYDLDWSPSTTEEGATKISFKWSSLGERQDIDSGEGQSQKYELPRNGFGCLEVLINETKVWQHTVRSSSDQLNGMAMYTQGRLWGANQSGQYAAVKSLNTGMRIHRVKLCVSGTGFEIKDGVAVGRRDQVDSTGLIERVSDCPYNKAWWWPWAKEDSLPPETIDLVCSGVSYVNGVIGQSFAVPNGTYTLYRQGHPDSISVKRIGYTTDPYLHEYNYSYAYDYGTGPDIWTGGVTIFSTLLAGFQIGYSPGPWKFQDSSFWWQSAGQYIAGPDPLDSGRAPDVWSRTLNAYPGLMWVNIAYEATSALSPSVYQLQRPGWGYGVDTTNYFENQTSVVLNPWYNTRGSQSISGTITINI